MNRSLVPLVLILTQAAFGLAGCIKHPVRSTPPIPDGRVAVAPPTPGDLQARMPDESLLQQRRESLDAGRIDRAALQAQAVFFEFDRSDIRASERDKLKLVKAYLDTHPAQRLILEGHCDWRGTAEYNLNLGDRRAVATKNFLQRLGVPADRLQTLSKGSLEAPRDADSTTMKKDRRVELVVVE
jgi:peptidoglycan-associated lipoprotein